MGVGFDDPGTMAVSGPSPVLGYARGGFPVYGIRRGLDVARRLAATFKSDRETTNCDADPLDCERSSDCKNTNGFTCAATVIEGTETTPCVFRVYARKNHVYEAEMADEWLGECNGAHRCKWRLPLPCDINVSASAGLFSRNALRASMRCLRLGCMATGYTETELTFEYTAVLTFSDLRAGRLRIPGRKRSTYGSVYLRSVSGSNHCVLLRPLRRRSRGTGTFVRQVQLRIKECTARYSLARNLLESFMLSARL